MVVGSAINPSATCSSNGFAISFQRRRSVSAGFGERDTAALQLSTASLHYARVALPLEHGNENLIDAAFRGNQSFTGNSGCVINDQQLFATLDTRATLCPAP
jgi:hypothetical protein